MKNINFKLLVAILLTVQVSFVNAQGCSDAGFCTVEGFKPNSDENNTKNKFKLGVSYGKADHAVSILGNYLEYSRQLNDKLNLSVKLTTLSQNNKDFSQFGLSDIFLNANYKINKKLLVTFGTKIPLVNGNKTKEGLPLPMDFQSSLGTFDLILGVGYKIKKIQFVAAVQQPITQNSNEFLATSYAVNSPERKYPSTNKFKRSGDVLLRASYPIELGNKFKLTPSILPIYHLANDTYIDGFNVKQSINGSQGLTINGNIYVDYSVNDKSALQFSVGMPFMIRDSRPDGLTRSFVANLEYSIKF